MKKILKALLTLALGVGLVLCVGSCAPKYANYTVTVVDEIGNPMSNVIVRFTDEEGNSKKGITDKEGVVTFEEFKIGVSRVELEKGFSDATLLQEEYTLDKKVTELRVVVRNENLIQDIYGEIPDGSFAYTVSDGDYSVAMTENAKFYLIFSPKTTGVYKVSLTCENDETTVGYYGIPMFVQSTHRGDGEYDGKNFELTVQDIGTPYVIGISSVAAAGASLKIERIADPPFDPMYAQWTEVESKKDLAECDTTGKNLVDLDIANANLSVTLGNDGYYYTNTGKLVYVRITSVTGHGKTNDELQFIPVVNGSLALLAGHVDQNVGSNVGGYVYDENGNFVAKYRYNEMIKTYMEYVDSTYGVVPLTEELANGIKLHGEHNGWWDKDSFGYIFEGVPVNSENAWLFLCMVEQ